MFFLRVGNPTLLFYMGSIEKNRKINELANSIAGDYGLEIADIELAGNQRRPILRVFIDKEQGVTLDECEMFSRALSALLDVEDPISSSYVLEVSSPGLDRPLKKKRDFEKSIGKKARIITNESLNNQNFFVGWITRADDEKVELLLDDKTEASIPFVQIAKAKLEIEFK